MPIIQHRCSLLILLCLLAGQLGAAEVSKTDLQALADRAEHELRGNILPFWLKNARNPANGGFQGSIDQQMKVNPKALRGSLLTSRILWTFSAAYRRYHDPEYLEMARWAYRDLIDHFQDKQSGGYFWAITAEGSPSDARKQVYGQVFAMYALAEYYRATSEIAALDQAKEVFQLLEKNAHDDVHGGYFDALSREWKRTTGARNNLLGSAPKSQNSHIHILEAYTNLLRVWPDEALRTRQRELIGILLTKIINPRTHHLVLFMKDDWTPVSDEISYGHDIELSWLLVEAAQELGDQELLKKTQAAALDIARVTEAEGVDRDGGIFNEGDPHGLTKLEKDWWPQAEAVVGFFNAYQISNDPQFFAASCHTWDFIEAKVVDRKNGDWYESLNRDGTPRRGSKLSIWKCPYHNSRSCLELLERIGLPEK